MLQKFLTKLFGSKYEREVKRLWPLVDRINETYGKLKDKNLEKLTEELIQRLVDGEDEESVMIDGFAGVKEACRRLMGKRWQVTEVEFEWNMIPFDVQLIGAVVLHQGKIAEMKTGEGKTLVATMPLYFNAIIGRSRGIRGEADFIAEIADPDGNVTKQPRGICHLVTVNDYLARRDCQWMGPVYESMGMTVGVIQQGMMPEERIPQYNCDITYGTNNEFGFDYLRDNMVLRWEDKVQRGHYYAIIDEVDSILIDEARTPLIISGPVEHTTDQFGPLNRLVSRVVSAQTVLVNRMVEESKRLLDSGDEFEAGKKLLQSRRGFPKHKRLLRLEQEAGIKKLIERVELAMMKEKKLHDLDEDLYFVVDEKGNVCDLTERGRNYLAPNDPEMFILPDLSLEMGKIARDEKLTPKEKLYEREKSFERYAKKSEELSNLRALLKAYTLFERDVDYVVQDGRVIIVDQFTGRLMPGRRYSDGIHQALEAKEGVRVQEETQTFATITIQNYFRMYEKLSGMTGTAATEASEFFEIYKLDVSCIPTKEPIRRTDYEDVVYKTKKEKYEAIINEIEKWHEKRRPILVGTTSVEVSELLSRLLKRKGIPHSVLNAKHHQKEAQIVALAGQPGSVTIATNMAGRGTDIKLHPDIIKCEKCCIECPDQDCTNCPTTPAIERCLEDNPCGLYILGTERHEARRIDNQLRGRSGRQGDPGSSRFFLSLEDDLMRLFGSDRVTAIMDRFGGYKGEPITHSLVTKAIANAQKRVESYHFEIRKRLLEYDNVMNKQREVIYTLRDEILKGEDLKSKALNIFADVIDILIEKYTDPKSYPETWNWEGLIGEFSLIFLSDPRIPSEKRKSYKIETLTEDLNRIARDRLEEREQGLGEEFPRLLRYVLLSMLDSKWRDHLYALDALREGISLRAYGQRDPLIEYKQESFRMFDELMNDYARDVSALIFRAQLRPDTQRPKREIKAFKPEARTDKGEPEKRQVVAKKKIGRNDPCPCGSGKKYKKCCGRVRV